MNSSAWRRNSSAIIGGWVVIVEITETRTPLPLHGLDQRSEVAVAGEQNHVVDMPGHLHRVDRELNVHIALDLAAAEKIDEFLRRLGHDRVAVVVEPIDQRPDRGIFLILDQRGVVKRPDQTALALEFAEQAFIINIESERFRGRVKVRAVNE